MNRSLFRTGERLFDELADAPNPKPLAADKARFGKLASLYTSFSCDFAGYALDICIGAGCKRIVDPFGGMGTVAEAGRSKALQLDLGDFSPFAALSCAFRSAPQDDILQCTEFVQRLAIEIGADDEQEFFSQLFCAAGVKTSSSFALTLKSPTAPEHRNAALTVYLAALSRIRLYKGFAGSNPTWVKRPDAIADSAATRDAVIETLGTVRAYVAHLPSLHVENRTRATWSSLESGSYEPGSIDAIVTSPPYANRTDYIRHYLPASELLLAAAGCDERTIRSEQIGTPLIRTDQPSRPLPASVTSILDRIRTHHGYASERYYYKGFLYYFSDMADALARMRSWLRPGGLLLMVVQDTYYKDLYVPTADMLVDIADRCGFRAVGRQDWRVNQRLSSLSPHSRRRMPSRALSESLIAFSR